MLGLAAGVSLAAGPPAPRAHAPWTFRSDFAHGLTGWMSFPLVQDIGFDPSLFTAQEGGRTVLVRQVQPLGRKRLDLGFIRPLKFFASPASSVQLAYSLRAAGKLQSLRLILAGADGRRYAAALDSAPGEHTAKILGSELSLPAAGAKIQAVLVVARLEAPPARARERLTLASVEIHAERPPEVRLAAPALNRSEVGGESVAREVFAPGSSLRVRLGKPQAGARLEISDPQGKQIGSAGFSAAGAAALALVPGATPGLWKATVTCGEARTVFHFLVLGAAPPHPRILLSAKRLQELRTLPRYAHLRAEIHRQARELAARIAYNSAAGANINHLPGGTGLHPGFVGELKAYFRLLENYSNAISYNALDYSLSGDEASLAAGRRALLTVARWQTWTPPRFTSHGLHTYYEVGVFTQRVALGYDLIAPKLSAAEKRQVADAFWRQIISPTVDEYYLYNRMPLAASNWMANSLGGALAADVAAEGDVPEWRQREGAALGELLAAYQELLRGLFPGDGSEAEPAGYENFAMRGLSWGEAALNGVGIRPRGSTRMEQGFWWPYYAMVRPDMVLDTGDFDGRLDNLPGFAWGAEHAGIPALRDFYDRSAAHVALTAIAKVNHTGRALEQASSPLDLVCCTKPAAEGPLPPPSRVFPLRGSAVLRSGWKSTDTVISLRAGPWFNHEHHDEGSFQVAAFGHKLVSEAGYSAYYTDPNYPVYFIQAPGHNTVLLDGDPFSQADYNGDFWAAFARHPHFTNRLLSPGFDYLAADLTTAYAGQLSHYQREFIFLKPDFLVVRDTLRAPAPHVYTWLLHAAAGAELSTAADRATIQVPGAAAELLAAGPADGWKLKATPISIIKFDDLDHGVIHTPREFYLQSARGRAASFLVGMRFSASAKAEGELKTLTFSAGKGIEQTGTAPLGVMVRTGAGALTLDGFSTDGDVLGVRGASGVLAVDARKVSRGGEAQFLSSVPATVAWQRTGAALEASVSAQSAAKIEFRASGKPSEVRVDGASATFEYRGGMAVLKISAKGEHRVVIKP